MVNGMAGVKDVAEFIEFFESKAVSHLLGEGVEQNLWCHPQP
jgi:hypothetical protein